MIEALQPSGEQAMRVIVTGLPDIGGLPIAMRISSIARCIADCIKVMADHYAAAGKYEQLSRLSDAALRRRGLSRENLARDVLAACDGSGRSDEKVSPGLNRHSALYRRMPIPFFRPGSSSER
jgi:hypothetical protein